MGNQYKKDCNCPLGQIKKVRSNLGSMVSLESPKMSAAEFYNSTIMNGSLARSTLYKMFLVYSVKPFDNTEAAKDVFSKANIEDARLVNELFNESSLDELPLYEGSYYCED